MQDLSLIESALDPQKRYVFHILPNAHLDPVWLWDWREGLNEGLATVRTILGLMDEFPQLTFIRGESSIYQHIEKTDARTFDRLGRMIESGRWDVVGGTYNQPDTNLASTETLCRQFEVGLEYFEKRFGIVPRVAWQADSFGHTPGLPNILQAFGMTNFAFCRPDRRQFSMESPVFWWKGDYDQRILCYRQYHSSYCSERHNLPVALDETLEKACAHAWVHVGVLMGLGNHGGGPSRRHLQEVQAWADAHPEVDVRFSTWHRLFDALRAELKMRKALSVPTLRGDMGFCLRGCYSSVMKLKSAHRRAEAILTSAEITQAAVAAGLNASARCALGTAWDGILFNSFHDILPGTSIERALEDQLALAGLVVHRAQEAHFDALNRLALQLDTSVPPPADADRPCDVPLVVWNSLPRPFRGWVELEGSLDHRPVWGCPVELGAMPLSLTGPAGEQPAFQDIATEHNFWAEVVWRKRVLAFVEIPPLGWKVFRLGYRDDRTVPSKRKQRNVGCAARGGENPLLFNRDWKVKVTSSRLVQIDYRGQRFLGGAGAMRIRTVEDIWGSWGGLKEEPESIQLETVQDEWSISEHAVLEKGPERVALWTRWEGGKSWLDLTYYLSRDAREVRVRGRLLWNERSARLQLVLPCTGRLEMQVPASKIERSQAGHLPCGRWFRRRQKRTGIGFVSDVLSDMTVVDDEVRVTLARATRYAADRPMPPQEKRWLPAVDCGELKFEFWLAPASADLERMSQELLQPPVVLATAPHPGPLADCGSLGHLEPEHLTLLAAQRMENGSIKVRVQNSAETAASACLVFREKRFPLGTLAPFQIKTAVIRPSGLAKQSGSLRNAKSKSLQHGVACV